MEVNKGMRSGKIGDLEIGFAQCGEKFWNFQKLVHRLAASYVPLSAIVAQSDVLLL